MTSKIKIALLCAVAVLAAACSPRPAKTAGITYENMDLSVRPGDDFAQYASGNWSALNPQPPEYPMWGVTTKVSDDNVKALAELIQDIAAHKNRKGSIAQKIGDIYNMMMDSTRLNTEGAAPLLAHLAEIRALETREDLLGYCAREHDDLLFGIGVSADDKDADNNIVHIGQGGLSLGNRDYYLSDDPQNEMIRGYLREHMKNLFVLAGYSEEDAQAQMEKVWAIENRIAVPYYSKELRRVPEANYHKMTVDELTAATDGFNWRKYLDEYRFDQTFEVDLGQPEPVAEACRILMTAPLEDLKAVYEWQLIANASSVLSDDFSDEDFAFNQKITGAQEKAPRWKNAVSLVDGMMSDAVGQMYVKKYFPKEAKAMMMELIGDLQASLGERIKAQEWMSEETKAEALEKLSRYVPKIGYPDKWDDLSGLQIDPSKSLYENIREASKFYWDLNYGKKYNKPVDKDEWLMSPQTVNAYYNPATNEICFPAGFLQPPLFDMNADAAANYGSIGVVIGHEMTHGFDDQGRQYDKDGNLKDWWQPEDAERFNALGQKMADYFSSLWVIPGELHANGTVCLGENIADHGGLNVAYNAFQMWQAKHGALPEDNGFTPEQRFFLSYATVWAGVTSEEMLRYLVMIDVHSPDRLRVNGALPQCDYWYDAFDIQPGDALYIAPEDRVKIW